MAKRLRVILQDPEYREIQHMALAPHVNRRVGPASAGSGASREPLGGAGKKLEVIRAEAQHDYPVGDIDSMLAEIEKGYGTGVHP